MTEADGQCYKLTGTTVQAVENGFQVTNQQSQSIVGDDAEIVKRVERIEKLQQEQNLKMTSLEAKLDKVIDEVQRQIELQAQAMSQLMALLGAK